MAIVVRCPSCGRPFQTAEANAGRQALCPACGGDLVVADSSELGPSAPFLKTKSDRAVSGLVLGMLSVGCLFVTGVPAVVQGGLALRDINRSRGRARGRALALIGIALGLICSTVLPPLLIWPVIRSVREESRRGRCADNVKSISAALMAYHYANGRLPAVAITDRQGQPLLSWRVAILPHLGPEGAALIRKVNLAEPWDGPTNRPLPALMPDVFRCPTDDSPDSTTTRYQAIVDPTGLFTGDAEGVPLYDARDEFMETLLFAEKDRPIPWTAPDDPAFDPTLLTGGIGSGHSAGAHLVIADGWRGHLVTPAGLVRYPNGWGRPWGKAFITRSGRD